MSQERQDREKKIATEYHQLVRKILPVGDIAMRRQTRMDMLSISQARQISQNSSEEAVNRVLSILTNKEDHSMLARSCAMIALYDIATEKGLWTVSLSEKVSNILKNSEDENHKIVLTGALWARFISERNNSDPEAVKTVFSSYRKHTESGGQQDYSSAVFGAARGMFELLHEKNLRMVFPVAVFYDSPNSSGSSELLQNGVPDSVMHLGQTERGHMLPSWKKMREAATYGMPNSINPTEQRLPHMMIGVQVKTETVNSIQEPQIQNRRELYHVSLDGMQTLTLVVAIRAARALEKDKDTGYYEATDVVVDKYIESIVTENLLDDDFVILKTAWHETNKTPFDLQKTLHEIKTNARNICIKDYQDNRLPILQTEEEIVEVVQNQVWEALSDEDKFEFALIEIRNMKSPIRMALSYRIELEEINSHLSKGTTLSDNAKNLLLKTISDPRIVEKIFISRFETIKDKSIIDLN